MGKNIAIVLLTIVSFISTTFFIYMLSKSNEIERIAEEQRQIAVSATETTQLAQEQARMAEAEAISQRDRALAALKEAEAQRQRAEQALKKCK